MLNTKRIFSKDLEQIRSVSAKLNKRLLDAGLTEDKINRLSLEELQDLDTVVRIATFMLDKHQDKIEMRTILKEFVDIISDSARSLETIDDEVSGLILEAEDSINKVKDMYVQVRNVYYLYALLHFSNIYLHIYIYRAFMC